MPALAWLEASSLSIWLRESEALWALPGLLFLHTLTMAVLAGFCIVLCLRALGYAASIPLTALRSFLTLVNKALLLSVITGLLLLIAYPTKALSNPVFYLKLLVIAVAICAWRGVAASAYSNNGRRHESGWLSARRLAALSTLAWLTAIALGRLLAYSYRHLLWSDIP